MSLSTALRSVRRKSPQKENKPETPGRSAAETAAGPLSRIGRGLKLTGIWIFRLRKIFMAIPVIYAAFRLAFYNMANLPEQVGLNLQVSGEFAQLVDRELAVYGPLGITMGCLLIMFFSRRALQPWVISIFTLILPLFLLLTNLLPR